jgi:hypothetical protein
MYTTNTIPLGAVERGLLRWIRQMHDALSQHRRLDPSIYAYEGPQHFLLERGVFFAPAPLPKRLPIRKRRLVGKTCYCSAWTLADAVEGRLRYVEGYAFMSGLTAPVPHAWCVDVHNRVVDVTWGAGGLEESAYFGVMFDVTKMRQLSPYLDDWEHRYPILKRDERVAATFVVIEPLPHAASKRDRRAGVGDQLAL